VATGKAWIGTIKEASCKNILKNWFKVNWKNLHINKSKRKNQLEDFKKKIGTFDFGFTF
jgi:hypothetical protein